MRCIRILRELNFRDILICLEEEEGSESSEEDGIRGKARKPDSGKPDGFWGEAWKKKKGVEGKGKTALEVKIMRRQKPPFLSLKVQ